MCMPGVQFAISMTRVGSIFFMPVQFHGQFQKLLQICRVRHLLSDVMVKFWFF